MAPSLSFFFFLLLSLSFSLSSSTVVSPAAGEILSRSHRLSMSLTLQLLSKSLFFPSNSTTIFAPPDSSFINSGQPSLSALKFHVLSTRIAADKLKSLPQGTTIPTLSQHENLHVTSSVLDGNLSINGVGVSDFAIYDDGSMVIYQIDDFFNQFSDPRNPSLPLKLSPTAPIDPGMGQDPSGLNPKTPFSSAVEFLKCKGYSKMASFLDMQLFGYSKEHQNFTVFAPTDISIDTHILNFGNYSSLFRGHVVFGEYKWSDLIRVIEKDTLRTFLDGFAIIVGQSGDILILNGVPVVFPDMFLDNEIVIHGLNDVIPMLARTTVTDDVVNESIKDKFSFSEYEDTSGVDLQYNPPDYGEEHEPLEN